jgi:hypothetical protein
MQICHSGESRADTSGVTVRVGVGRTAVLPIRHHEWVILRRAL